MLAVTGGKGGCGKTTTALGLARTLARRGHDPLVLDADCDMPDLHHLAGIKRTDGVDALARGAPLSRVCQRPPSFPGVAVVTAGRPARTGPALRATHDWEGPVLVDCPAGIGPDASRPLRQADATAVVSTDHPQCLDDTRRTVTAARQLDAPPVGVLLRTVTGRAAEVGGRVAGSPVLATLPDTDDPFDAPPLAQAWSTVADHLLGPDNSTDDTEAVDRRRSHTTDTASRIDRDQRQRRARAPREVSSKRVATTRDQQRSDGGDRRAATNQSRERRG
ncbi:MAG: hypothetical protein J07HX64_02506 [halophilic archaeon J07HX64]|jgi:ATPases involved in chromosome partitioning|nr:MAG: hypothetical protein J07HX64_02506 [halophilic archaeon J07HX64]